MHAENHSPDESQKGDYPGMGHAVETKETVLDTTKLRKGNRVEDEPNDSALRAYFRLWTYANFLDVVLCLIGSAAALGGGLEILSIPSMAPPSGTCRQPNFAPASTKTHCGSFTCSLESLE